MAKCFHGVLIWHLDDVALRGSLATGGRQRHFRDQFGKTPALSLDSTAVGQLPVPLLRFLRSSLFIAIVSVLVLTGYACDVSDDDCEGGKHEQTAQCKTPSGKDAPAEKGDCQCLCHQIFTIQIAPPPRIASGTMGIADYLLHVDESPPDAVPPGIYHPPQIA